MNELVAALVTGGVSIVGAVVALIVSWLNTKRIRGEMDSLRREIDAGGVGIIFSARPVVQKFSCAATR